MRRSGWKCVALAVMLCWSACSKAPPSALPSETEGRRGMPDPVAGARILALAAPAGDGKLDQVIKRMQENARVHPDKVDVWITLGEAWLKKARESLEPERYLQANAAADVALAISPGFTLALDIKGLVLLNDHQFREARELAQQVLEKDPEDLIALGVLADALEELGDIDGAVKATERMMSLKPNLASYSRASHLRWLQGDAPGAIQVARLAIDASAPGEPSAWAISDAAALFWHQGDIEGAEAGYNLALQRMGNFPPALVGKARILMARRQFKEAAELLRTAQNLYPSAETAWLLGDALTLAEDRAGAEAAYADVQKQGRAGDHRTLAYFLAARQERVDEAVKLIERELKERGGIYTRDVAAWAYFRAGRLEDARRESDAAMAVGTRDARLLYHGGAIRIAQGQTREGLALVEAALKQQPHFDVMQAAEATALLARHRVKASR